MTSASLTARNGQKAMAATKQAQASAMYGSQGR
jgi:hypothetical protein